MSNKQSKNNTNKNVKGHNNYKVSKNVKNTYTVKKKVSNKETLEEVPILKFESLSDNGNSSKIKNEENKIKPIPIENIKVSSEEVEKKELSQEETKETNANNEEDKVKSDLNNSSKNINEQIQSFVSILFTIIIFVALVLLIIILYNNYFKKKEEINYEEVCADYIEKDYGITEEMITNFVRNGRAIIYNYNNFDKSKLTNEDLIKFASYLIWSEDLEYEVCDPNDKRCLVSKKEMDLNTLQANLRNYLDIKNLKIEYPTEYSDDDKTRLYEDGDKVILTFSEFEYQTLRHNIVATSIKEDKVIVTFALEKLIDDTNIYSYVGYKTLELKYHDKNFSIEKIETSLKN